MSPNLSPKLVQNRIVAVIVLGLSGLALALEGFYFADGSGLLFGNYVCFGGIACGGYYEYLRSIFWLGMYLLLPGLVLIIASGLFSWGIWRARLEGGVRLFAGRSQKRTIISTSLIALMLVVAFLAPIVPFNTTSPQAPRLDSFPHVDVCYQTSSGVNNPEVSLWGFETIIRSLSGIGNFVYVQCTVSSA